MYKFGPYGPNHSTAATFAFRRELLKQTRYDDNAALAEEKLFLKNYTIPFVQLDSMKSILVFSHIHNSFDKKVLLEQGANDYVKLSEKTIDDFVKESNIKRFFMEEIDTILEIYEPGRPENKPEVLKQMAEMKKQREQQQQTLFINNLISENNELKIKIEYLENKIKEIIQKSILEKKTQI
jgi:hypothetical protein